MTQVEELLAATNRSAKLPAVDSGLLMDSHGRVVIGQNGDRLPDGCGKLSEDAQLIVHVGGKFADLPQRVYGYNQSTWQVKPCARLTVTLANGDQVRHQWVVRGLPEELYPGGMFALEASGGERVTGTFILPPQDRTYLVRSEVFQKSRQGMTAQLIVGDGGEFSSSLTNSRPETLFSGMLVLGFVTAVLGAPYLFDWLGRRFFGMKGGELSGYLFNRLVDLVCLLVQAFTSVLRLVWPKRKA